MKDALPIPFIRACTENMSVQSSFFAWLDAEREKVIEHCANATVNEEIYRLQGEARCIRRLRSAIAAMTRMKGEVDDEQRLRRVR